MRKLIASALVLSCLATAPTLAQDQQTLSPEQAAEAQQILKTARDVATYGEVKEDPLALITAAKMFVSVPGGVLADGETGAGGKPYDLEGLLSKAEEYGKGDELISKTVADIRGMSAGASKYACYWAYYCNAWGYCEYAYACY